MFSCIFDGFSKNFLGKNRGLQLVANKNLSYAQNELVGYCIGKKVRWHR